jgi:hypothetical protein
MSRERRSPLRVQAYLCMDLAAGKQRVVEAGRSLFRLGFELLGHELYERVAQAVAEGRYLGPESARAVAGEVSATCGMKMLDDAGRAKERHFTYSPRKFDSLMALFDDNPALVGLDVHTWKFRSQEGQYPTEGQPSLHISWHRATTSWASPLPDWVLLYVDSTYEHVLGTPERQATVVDLLRRVAGSVNPACGEVSYRPQNPYTAPLEHLLQTQRSPQTSIAESRHTVRSYSWMTIISEEIGQRLGGEVGLRTSGAFWLVEHLHGGGFLLQATELFEQYRHEQAYKVFRVLAPVLPRGIPRAPKIYPPDYPKDDEPDFMIVQEDPSSAVGARGARET